MVFFTEREKEYKGQRRGQKPKCEGSRKGADEGRRGSEKRFRLCVCPNGCVKEELLKQKKGGVKRRCEFFFLWRLRSQTTEWNKGGWKRNAILLCRSLDRC